jgi:hypothetical protein
MTLARGGFVSRLHHTDAQSGQHSSEDPNSDGYSNLLCPPEQRRRSGMMEKKFIPTASLAGASSSVCSICPVSKSSSACAVQDTDRCGTMQLSSWLPRYAVLSEDKLAFVRTSATDDVQVIDHVPLHEISLVCPSVLRHHQQK